jgi:hypothetical protein
MSHTTLDFTTLTAEQFEDLIEALFRAKASLSPVDGAGSTESLPHAVLTVSRSGRGADEGRDLLLTTLVADCIAPRTIRWVVQCKHKAVSGKSVSPSDFAADFHFREVLSHHNATGYLLACSTRPSTRLQSHLDKLTGDSDTHMYVVWDYAKICEEVFRHEGVMRQFFPETYRRHKNLVSSDSIEQWIEEYDGAMSEDAKNALRGVLAEGATPSDSGADEAGGK